jgi:sugar phosphate isomerase/epimerase
MYMKFDEVPIGEGIIDYRTYVQRVAELEWDVPCFVEHFPTEGDFAISFAQLHRLASKVGASFLPRNVKESVAK